MARVRLQLRQGRSVGLIPGIRVHLTRNSDGPARMELEGLEAVSRTVGFAD